MEMHILELPKLPPEQKSETDLMQWMRFLNGKRRRILRKWLRRILVLKKRIKNWTN